MKMKVLSALLILVLTPSLLLAARPSINTLNTRVNQLEAENSTQQSEIDDLDVRVTALEDAGVLPPPFGVVGTVAIDDRQYNLLELYLNVEAAQSGPSGGLVYTPTFNGLSVLVDSNEDAAINRLFSDFGKGVVFSRITISTGTPGLIIELDTVSIKSINYKPENDADYSTTTQVRLAFFPEKISVMAPNGTELNWDLRTFEVNGCSQVPQLYSNANQEVPGSFKRASISGTVTDPGSIGGGGGASGPELAKVRLEGLQTVDEIPCYIGAITVANTAGGLGDGTVNIYDPTELLVSSFIMSGMVFTNYEFSLTVEGLKQDATIASDQLEFPIPPPPK